MPDTDFPTGLVALHGNRAETLVDTLSAWLQRHPLAPLENEVVLVQSNGMAEWVKLALARQNGVCAATEVLLPSRFLWRTSRQVLDPHEVPHESPLDKLPLTWRLMALLPQCLPEPVFAPLRGFFRGVFRGHSGPASGEPDRLLQLASRLADLFDQYQIYRPDWLQDWAANTQGAPDVCRRAGEPQPVAGEHAWQPVLWRRVLAGLSERERAATRPALHQRVLDHLHAGQAPVQAVARRVSVFGMSHMPQQLLQLLAALGQHSQVLLAVPNPCRYHWADIMDGREWLRSERRRHAHKDTPLHTVDLAQMHLHAPTLLASWGRQGRDFVRMLDAFDDAQAARQRLQWPTLDFFDDAPIEPGTPMLQQLQRRMRDLLPSTEQHPAQPLPAGDASVLFRQAHSPVRELEVLHDQLLDWLGAQASPFPDTTALTPRDVVVMVPDIERMAAAIHAVFGQYPRSDPRHIPYAIADRGALAGSALMAALLWLLRLPQERFQMSDWVALLEVPALARRFGLNEQALPVLTRWMQGAGIRWGLTAQHRAGLGLQACGEVNTALFGVQRMLMGYACGGQAPTQTAAAPTLPAQPALLPYDEVGGLDAALAGSLARLLQVLIDWWQCVQSPATPAQWAERLRQLLAQCFAAHSEAERQELQALQQALQDWLRACEGAGFAQEVPLEVAREAWLGSLRLPQLEQRFRAGGVTFCTLMPMRAIPFRVVCLLGMNDGDYPRRAPQSDFDLMALAGMARPGDRSRRDDDRQLMLEALLSARDALYVSWCGRSVRDNSEQAPSVLVSQLRDEIDLLWGKGSAQARTVAHPLQPFGRAYFTPGSGLHTYAHEWASLATATATVTATATATATVTETATATVTAPSVFAATSALSASPTASTLDPNLSPSNADLNALSTPVLLSLSDLARFLRRPVGTFFAQRLQVHLHSGHSPWQDEEPFDLDGLPRYELLQEALGQVPPDLDAQTLPAHVQALVQRWLASGALPLAGVGRQVAGQLQALLRSLLQAALRERAGHRCDAPRLQVQCAWPQLAVQVDDVLSGLWQPTDAAQGESPPQSPDLQPGPKAPPLCLLLRASSLLSAKGKNGPAASDAGGDSGKDGANDGANGSGNDGANGSGNEEGKVAASEKTGPKAKSKATPKPPKKAPLAVLPDKLIEAWLVSLAASATGQALRVVLIGRDALVRAPLWPQAQAQASLHTLVQAWCEGMRQPLPLPPALALAWLDKQGAQAAPDALPDAAHDATVAPRPETLAQLQGLYEEEGFAGRPALVRQDPALHRCFPTLHSLLADGRFAAWAGPVYQGLLDWSAQCDIQPLPEGEAPDAKHLADPAPTPAQEI